MTQRSDNDEPRRRFWEFRVGLCFALALSPVVVAAVLSGPSVGLFAAFGSGCLLCVVLIAVGEAEERQVGAMSTEPNEVDQFLEYVKTPEFRESWQRAADLLGGGDPKVEAYMTCLADQHADALPEEYIAALEAALRERLRVNVGLLMENSELRRRLAV